ncbi:MAG: ATP-binding protein [Roseiarcus sp.]|jgi:signal transduction histidine kinase
MPRGLNAQSIATRLFLSAAFWCSAILVVAGLGLSAVHARSTEAAFDEQLGVYLKALVANVATNGLEGLSGSGQFIGPQFELARSGWYWQITRLDAQPPDVKSSRSLFAAQLPRVDGAAANADANSGRGRSAYVTGPDERSLRMIERIIDAGDEGRYLIQVAGNSEEIEAEIDDFEYALAATFVLLLAAILGSMALAVRFGLRPLRELRDGVASIRRGEAERITGEFPQDIAPLAAEVNLLLDANREVVDRARTQVGNLAHALKTPLSVILNEADAGSPTLAEKVKEQAEVMRRQVSFYLDRARAAARAGSLGAATDVKPVIEGLVRTFDKLYRDRALTFAINAPEGLRFRGEVQDLSDLIGNLLDNAGKWARARVAISAARDPDPDAVGRAFFVTQIDDDGPGLDPQARSAALRRGQKLDESRPGSGLGLSIIVDLAQIYGGSLLLEDSPLGGLRATLRLPAW